MNPEKLLIVIDMQNDFITGALANPSAEAIVPGIRDLVAGYDGMILFTRDTHFEDGYFESQEGEKLPVLHCVLGTPGWEVERTIEKAAENGHGAYSYINKYNFGSLDIVDEILAMYENTEMNEPKIIDIVGTCTDICVVSNAMILKAAFPESKINIHGNLCAGLTEEKHKAALSIMESCQMNIL